MSGDNEILKYERYELCEFHIMAGGITLKCQPISMIIGNMFKGYHYECYDVYMMADIENNKEKPMPPTCQLFAQWVVKARG